MEIMLENQTDQREVFILISSLFITLFQRADEQEQFYFSFLRKTVNKSSFPRTKPCSVTTADHMISKGTNTFYKPKRPIERELLKDPNRLHFDCIFINSP